MEMIVLGNKSVIVDGRAFYITAAASILFGSQSRGLRVGRRRRGQGVKTRSMGTTTIAKNNNEVKTGRNNKTRTLLVGRWISQSVHLSCDIVFRAFV